jgi:hypothetical protein
MLSTPFGRPALWDIFTSSIVLRGVLLEGFVTTVFPVINAGASLRATVEEGKFHGVMEATTPIGNFKMVIDCLGKSLGSASPVILLA